MGTKNFILVLSVVISLLVIGCKEKPENFTSKSDLKPNPNYDTVTDSYTVEPATTAVSIQINDSGDVSTSVTSPDSRSGMEVEDIPEPEPTPEPRIMQISDINDNVINKLKQYSYEDFEAGLSNMGSFGNNKSYMLEHVTKTPRASTNDIIFSGCDYYNINKYDIHLISIDLLLPKEKSESQYGNNKGLIKLNYQLDIDLDWQYRGYNEIANYSNTIFVSYLWDVDLENYEMPIEDYNAYKFDYSNSETDYDIWYNKNIVAEKGKYTIDEMTVDD